jgi:hypothetical protein
MAKRVFFSFHYQDVIDFRANVVRNHWVTKEHRDDAGFFDASLWENSRRTSPESIKKLINDGLKGTSVTVVLIGDQTYDRRWVRYEIMKSIEVQNKVIGIHINSITDKNQRTKANGLNPFDFLGVRYNQDGSTITGLEYRNQWQDYSDLSGSLGSNQDQSLWSQSLKLSHFFRTYDWITDNGYNNFASWVDS